MVKEKEKKIRQLASQHTPHAIEKRLAEANSHSYLKDFIYGAVDGAVTTFAIVSGVAGAGLHVNVVIIMGLANLIADGFSMAVGNYLGTRAEIQVRKKAYEEEKTHVDLIPEGEKEEVRQIFKRKGFEGDILEKVVEVITADKERWIDVMLTEEHGFSSRTPSPLKAALSTFLAFVAFGSIPLIAFFYQFLFNEGDFNAFFVSCVMTGFAFFMVGALKSRYIEQRWWVAGLETLIMGGIAAAMAYMIGGFLRGLGT